MECEVSHFLLKQHSMPFSKTGKVPAERLMRRRLRSELDYLRPDYMKNPDTRCPEKTTFEQGGTIYINSLTVGPRKRAATVVAEPGPVMCIAGIGIISAEHELRSTHLGRFR